MNLAIALSTATVRVIELVCEGYLSVQTNKHLQDFQQ